MNHWKKHVWALIATMLVVGALSAGGLSRAQSVSYDDVSFEGVSFEIMGSHAAWTLAELNPGQVTVIPGAQQLAIVSQGPWELVVASRLLQPEDLLPVRSAVYLGIHHHGNESLGSTEWIPVSTETRFVSRRGGPTGPDGESISLDLQVRPSWDDPPGVPLVAEVTATLTAGDEALLAYALPSRIAAGSGGPISFWYRVPDAGRLAQGDSVRLDIWKADTVLVARRYFPVVEGDWQHLVWTDLPEGGLEVGSYRFRIVDADERLLGSGVFQVVAGGPGGVGVAVGPLGLAQAGTGNVHERAQGDFQSQLDPPWPEETLPDVRLVVTGDPAPPGEPGEWTITVINPEPLSLAELQLEVCLPPGWSFWTADVPWTAGGAGEASSTGGDTTGRYATGDSAAGGNAAGGNTGIDGAGRGNSEGGMRGGCRVYLLGTLLGNKEKKVRIGLIYWPDDGVARVPLRNDLSLRLTGVWEPGGPRVVLREARLALAPAADPLWSPSIVLQGRVFVDVNETGAYEADEPVAPGAKVVVDGRVVATANRRGEYRVTLTEPPRLVWAVSDRGESRPVSVVYDELWVNAGQLDLPLIPAGNPEMAAGARGPEATGGHVVVLGQAEGYKGSGQAGVSVRALVTGPSGELTAEVSAGADGTGLKHAVKPDRPNAQADDPLSAIRLDDVKISGHARDGAIHLRFAHESGLPRDVKMGLLRPTKPVERAYRFQIDVDPRRLDSGGYSPGYGPTVGPGALPPGTLTLGSEWGYAEGDVWSCRVYEGTAAYILDRARVAANWRRAAHERLERTGLKEEEARELKLELDGGLEWARRRWPVRLEVTGGLPRKLSPSCGLSPFDGWKWRAIVAPPLGAGVQAIEWSGMSWPMPRPAQEEPSPGGRAYELGITYRPLYWRDERIDVSTAVQWETRDGELATAPRLAARLRSRIGGVHDVRLELGALALASTSNPNHLSRGDRRLAFQWRVVRGDLRPWLKTELFSQEAAMARSLEAGIQLSRRLELPWWEEPVDTALRASRKVDPDDVEDKARVDVRLGPATGRWEWSGTAPIPTGQTSVSDVVHAFVSAKPFVTYEKTSHKLQVDGAFGEGALGWTLSLTQEAKIDELAWEALAIVSGQWSRESLGEDERTGHAGRTGGKDRSGDGGEVRGVEDADRGEDDGIRYPWTLGRWEVGLGRSISEKNGDVSEAISSVIRAGGRRGPWGVQVEALHKVGFYDWGLRHAAYDVMLRRYVGDEWSGLFHVGRRLAEGRAGGWKYRLGVERRVGGALTFGINLVWELTDGPADGSGQGPGSVSGPGNGQGAGPSQGPALKSSPQLVGPRLEASVAVPYLW